MLSFQLLQCAQHPQLVELLGSRRVCAFVEAGVEGQDAIAVQDFVSLTNDRILLLHEMDGIAEDDDVEFGHFCPKGLGRAAYEASATANEAPSLLESRLRWI